jgi:DNA replication protein DnaC
MTHEATLPVLLKELRLPCIYQAWQNTQTQAEKGHWTYGAYLATLCEKEVESRSQKRLQGYVKQSGLPIGKTLSSFVFEETPGLNKAQIERLASSRKWVDAGENLILFGASGTGKTHIACAIGYGLIALEVRVCFVSTTTLVQKLQAARRELALPQALHKLNRYDVLILDDIGYVRKDEDETNVLFELIAERYESKSLIITCNQPFSEWDSLFSTNAMTVAAIDRIVHHATIIQINQQESYRKKKALTKNQTRTETPILSTH